MKPFMGKFIKLYILWFLVFATLIITVCCIFYHHEKRHLVEAFQSHDQRALSEAESLWNHIFITSAQDILLIRYTLETNPDYFTDLTKTSLFFKKIIENTGIYMQVRILSPDGMEMVKIITLEDIIQRVPEAALQNKRDRYYYQQSILLERDVLFVSPVDLNEENQKIEVPFQPTMRLAVKLFRNNRIYGYLVTNILLKTRLDFIQQHVATMGQLMIANTDGFFIQGIHPEDTWGGQLPDRKDKKLQTLLPELWKAWQHQDQGQLQTQEGWIVFKTTRPFADASIQTNASDAKFLLASFYSNSILHADLLNIVRRALLASLLAACVALLLTFQIVKTQLARNAVLEAVQQQNATLIRLDETKQSFFSMVTHDLRTPLTAMKGFLFLLIREGLGKNTPQQRDALETVNRHCERMLQMVNDLLDAGKIASGRFDVVLQPCELIKVVRETVTGIQSLTAEKSITIDIRFDDESLVIPLDPDRFRQALVNLLGNSIKFSPPDSRITIRQHRLDTECLLDPNAATPQFWETPSVWLSLCDQGQGLSAEELPHIFDAYYQAAQSAAQKKKGTGLGLGIAHGIIESHHGMLWAESPGRGLGVTFNILLPLEIPD